MLMHVNVFYQEQNIKVSISNFSTEKLFGIFFAKCLKCIK